MNNNYLNRNTRNATEVSKLPVYLSPDEIEFYGDIEEFEDDSFEPIDSETDSREVGIDLSTLEDLDLIYKKSIGGLEKKTVFLKNLAWLVLGATGTAAVIGAVGYYYFSR